MHLVSDGSLWFWGQPLPVLATRKDKPWIVLFLLVFMTAIFNIANLRKTKLQFVQRCLTIKTLTNCTSYNLIIYLPFVLTNSAGVLSIPATSAPIKGIFLQRKPTWHARLLMWQWYIQFETRGLKSTSKQNSTTSRTCFSSDLQKKVAIISKSLFVFMAKLKRFESHKINGVIAFFTLVLVASKFILVY